MQFVEKRKFREKRVESREKVVDLKNSGMVPTDVSTEASGFNESVKKEFL